MVACSAGAQLLLGNQLGAADSLVWVRGEGHRYAELAVPSEGRAGFTLLSPSQTGVTFTNTLSPEAEAQNQNLLNGSGLALGDYDGDGWCDIWFCNLNGRCALFRNLGGWKFEDVTDRVGLTCSNKLARGATFADVDGDGHLDLLVTFSGEGTRLFRNDGHGHFRDAQAAELRANTGSTSLALGDVDGDGTLDLYVANYGENTIRSGMRISTRIVNGKEEVTGRFRNRLKIVNGNLVEYGEPDVLYLNDGHGRFQAVSWTGGAFLDEAGVPLTAAPWDLGFTVTIRDINQDGRPDIYVCNDFQDPDRIWIGDGRGHFRAIEREAIRSICNFSMTVDFADINLDGWDDFFVTDMLSRYHPLRMTQLAPPSPPPEITLERAWDRPQVRRNMLFVNRCDGTYAEIANYAGVAASDWSWSAVFLDVDLDGFEDVLVGNGHYYDTQDLDAIAALKRLTPEQRRDGRFGLSLLPPLRTPNVAFRNRGDLTFEEVGKAWGFDSLEVSHSIALADLDNDGDLDVVVNCLRGPALLYRNDSTRPRVAVRLKGQTPNTAGIGARIRLLGGAQPSQGKEMTCGGRYLSGDAAVRVFAAGTLTNDMTIEVDWRGGKRSVVRGVRANRLYEIDEASAIPMSRAPVAATNATPHFQDVSSRIAHQHHQTPWDDYSRQRLLPRQFSQLGPGVAWLDLDGDGHEDLVIGSGAGGHLAVFHNDGAGGFQLRSNAMPGALPEDAAGLAGWSPRAGQSVLLAGLSNYKSGSSNASAVLRFDCAGANVVEAAPLPGGPATPGPLALGDLNGDGELDLFVGGRLIPGRYPEAAASHVFLNRGGKLIPDAEIDRQLERLGLVSGAVFSDLDGDGRAELVVACEWGPVRVFGFEGGRLRERTQELGLAGYSGLWTSVTTGDFDEDGRLDIVAGNWGLNSPYHQVAPGPWYLYYGDFNGDQQVHILEAYRDTALNQIVPWRDLQFLEPDLPWLRERFPTHKAFSQASLDDLLADRKGGVGRLEINTLASMIFLNRGGRFEARPLPMEAQWSPAFGLSVGDLDGDGHEDLFVSQNFFGLRKEDGRLDAGRGLWLRGDGQGGFRAVPGQESGIRIYGEQRGCALADFDEDGRVDLVVAQNGGDTKLYRNAGARPGMRIRLLGPAGNASGLGVGLQLEAGGRWGPVREIHGGAGYWSQDGAIQVMASPDQPTSLRVRWPGGKTTESPIPSGARTVVVDPNGRLEARQ